MAQAPDAGLDVVARAGAGYAGWAAGRGGGHAGAQDGRDDLGGRVLGMAGSFLISGLELNASRSGRGCGRW